MLETIILSEYTTSVIFSEVFVWERYVYPRHILEKGVFLVEQNLV
jgi:hypothetical protein